MRKLVAVLMSAGVMAAAGTAITTPAEAHWRSNSCCTSVKKVRYFRPVTNLVRKVEYVRVRSYRTVVAKKLYSNRCGCRRFFRTVRYSKPVVTVVPKVSYVRVRAYKAYVATKLYRRHCCCRRWW